MEHLEVCKSGVRKYELKFSTSDSFLLIMSHVCKVNLMHIAGITVMIRLFDYQKLDKTSVLITPDDDVNRSFPLLKNGVIF